MGSTMEDPVITLNGLTKRYGDLVAVDRLSLTIRRGEIFGLLGPNGAGKSTTILMMLGMTEPSEGSAVVCGVDPTRQPILVKKKVGYLADDVGFYDDMNAVENLMFTARLNGIPDEEGRKEADRLLEQVGLTEAKFKKVGTYSRGMRQRLGLADVLIKRPEVIILDEPTLGLDPEGIKELMQLIRRLSRQEKITVLLSSHQLHQVQEVCDRVGLFVRGKLLAQGDVESLANQLFPDEKVEIRFRLSQSPDTLIEEIRGLEHAISLQHDAGSDEWIMRAHADISPQIAELVVNHKVQLLSLKQKTFGLDEIYLRYFEGSEAS
ncbi:ABC transporter ATP-binding protein [Insulibacter thermoxylanivorax]|uniref:ABC transporter ATP-binding protein n=1 Tax=Insulibacter thermoxylanivorax TaxID=2749268 RepID=A0A916QEA1_9BACL|nr:ABC transporter ATP-binding protein [Insulibacter thermoxylanivorax]